MAPGTRHLQTRTGIAAAVARVHTRVLSAFRIPLAALALLVSALALPSATQAQPQSPATLMADQIYVDRAGRLIASGSVEVWQDSVRLTAQRVVYDSRRDHLQIDGPISVNDGPDILFLADSAELSPNLRAGILHSARIVLDRQLQISAASIVRDPSGINQLTSVVASSCPVCAADPTPLWEIRAARVTHDEATDQLLFERAQFRFAGVPIFYLPRLRLPGPAQDRSRGILPPNVNLDSDLGLSVGLPYFIPIGDTQDVTLTPMLSTDGLRGMGFRWRMARTNGGIEIGGQITRDNILPGELRGYAYVRALFALSNDFKLTTDLIGASDHSYLETYDITSAPRLTAHVTLERVRRDQMARARALAFYSMRAGDINDELPNAVAQAELDQRIGLGHTAIGGTLRLQMGAQAFRRESATDGVQGRDVSRAHLQLTWRRTEVLAGGILATGALDGRVDHVRVADDSAYPDPVTRRVGQAMIEFRWPWAMTTDSGARHVIEPVVQAIESRRRGGALPNDDHTMPELDEGSLFALTRYSGEDARDDGSRVNAGLRWTRHDPSGWTSEALVGRIWRRAAYDGFDPAHVQPLGRETSDWLLAGRLSHQDGYALSLRVLVAPDSTVSRAETRLDWAGRMSTISTAYLYLPDSPFENRTTPLSEWSVDVGRQFGNGWSSSVGWDYDVAQQLFATARAGLEFRNECLAFDMSFSRQFVTATNPTASTRFNMQIDLLGIGGRAPTEGGRSCRT